MALNSATRMALSSKSVSRAGSSKLGPIESPASKSTVKVARSFDSLASEASGPPF